MDWLILIALAGLALLSISLLKTFRHVSERELKRRARSGDELAKALFKAAAYGPSLNAVLWFLVGITNGVFFLFVAQHVPSIFAVFLSAGLLWYGFLWMPARDVSHFSAWIAARLAPAFAWLLNYLHPVLDKIGGFMSRHRPVTVHTGLYDRADLLTLLEDQKVQPDNWVEKLELEIAQHALTFGDKPIRDVMIPRRVVRLLSATESIGPVLMSELHDSGFSRFPVHSGKKDNIVGVLYLRDLMRTKPGGHLEKYMNPDVVYVHEDQPLTDALQAILKTKRHLFVVVNSFEEFVGIITMEDVLEQIVGRPIVDEFDQYDDLRAVAARSAKKEHQKNNEPQKPKEDPTPEPPEVVK